MKAQERESMYVCICGIELKLQFPNPVQYPWCYKEAMDRMLKQKENKQNYCKPWVETCKLSTMRWTHAYIHIHIHISMIILSISNRKEQGFEPEEECTSSVPDRLNLSLSLSWKTRRHWMSEWRRWTQSCWAAQPINNQLYKANSFLLAFRYKKYKWNQWFFFFIFPPLFFFL